METKGYPQKQKNIKILELSSKFIVKKNLLKENKSPSSKPLILY